ncbi:MAG: right-handed parallel beta-helix repeat-containing protein [bacterium]
MKKVLVTVLCLSLAVLLALLYPLAIQADAATLCVDCSGEDPNCFQSIQDAIGFAKDGDVIIIKPGTCNESIDFFRKAVTIRSIDPNDPDIVAATVIDTTGLNKPAVFFMSGEDPNSVLSGLTLKNGKDVYFGGGIYCHSSSPTITHCIIKENQAGSHGGGIYCRSSSPYIIKCIIEDNSAGVSGGGLYCESSSPEVTGCIIRDNSAGKGAGIFCESSSFLKLKECSVSENEAAGDGGGIYCESSSPDIGLSVVTSNSANNGAGVFCKNSSSLKISGCTISENKGNANGGGIYCQASSPNISICNITGNLAGASGSGYGGGIYCCDDPNGSSPIITECTISYNSAASGGGAFFSNSSPTIERCNISWNAGSGIHCKSSSPDITDCTIRGNSANNGAGIFCENSSSPKINKCVLARNKSVTNGGGIYCNSAPPDIYGCIIKENSAGSSGGGIYCSSLSKNITNCLIIDNKARNGGGIYNSQSSLTFYYCSIVGNMAERGAGIYCYYCTTIIKNCILWNNYNEQIYRTGGSDPVVTYSDIQGGYGGEGNINRDPSFVQTGIGNYYLNSDSPCIDSGDPNDAPVQYDQAAITRPQGVAPDMGAYEYVAPYSCSLCADPDSCTPRASFTVDVTSGFSPLKVEFDASSSGGIICNDSGDTNCPQILWDFGDGNTASGMTVSHTFNDYGFYDVSLTIANGCNDCGTHSIKLYDAIYAKSPVPTIEVGMDEEYTYQSIQDAIDHAVDGEMIMVHDGTYFEKINFKGKRITVYSENGPLSAIIDGSLNGSVVTFDYNEGVNSVLDGFTIQNGSASNGGGIYCYLSSPHIENCIIKGNSVSSSGGGIYCYVSSPSITKCKISENHAVNGGGIYCAFSLPYITECTITRNISSQDGGGIYYYYSPHHMVDCLISENTARDGGGIYFNNSSPAIFECTFHNCTIINNTSRNGGGIYCYYSNMTISNCTATRNMGENGGGIYSNRSTIVIKHCIFWNDYNGEIYRYAGNIPVATYSDIQGGYTGVGNINNDPLFLQTEIGNYYLDPNSPCIDTGDPNDPSVNKDKAGIIRPQGAAIDMGAYEYVDPDSCSPRASFTLDKPSGFTPLKVGFDASASGGTVCNDSEDPNCPYILWDFGDGNTASGMTVSHTYSDHGFYDVSLTVTNNCGTHTLKLPGAVYAKSSGPTMEVGKEESFAYHAIQDAIDDADDGEMILVHDGTYSENINFNGKRITVYSENGPAATIIDGGSNGSVVDFYNEGIYSELDGFTIQNGSGGNGGGIWCSSSSPIITNCLISGNYASSNGGGFYCYLSSPSITNCIIGGNLAAGNGGGIYCDFSFPHITKSTISQNITSQDGAGIYCRYSPHRITNCLIIGNTARNGGGITSSYSYSTIFECSIYNCTFMENTSENGGGIYFQYASPMVKHCILWNDFPNEIYRLGGSPVVTYSLVQGGYSGEGNIDKDPEFVQPEIGNFYLSFDSPCIDAGDPEDVTVDDDKEGIPRSKGAAVDLGAYEYVDRVSCTPRASFTVNKLWGYSPLTVGFDASSSGGILSDPDDPNCHDDSGFLWDFGDGSSASGMMVSHTYNHYGVYDVSLTLANDCATHSLPLSEVVYVKSPVPTREVGTEAEHPYNSIQEAIDDADDGEAILIHDGTYSENINFGGKKITIFSENGPSATIIDGNSKGSAVTFYSLDYKKDIYSVLDGFTIRNGSASNGGGIYCYSSSPYIINCIIEDNSAGSNGGGIYCYSSSPEITKSIIKGNSAGSSGGGIYHYLSSPKITKSKIVENLAVATGGGIYCNYDYSLTSVVNCIIAENLAGYEGGGIYFNYSSTSVTNCTITENPAGYIGGAIYCYYSSPVITNCILWNNWPGEIYNYQSNPRITCSDIKGGYAGEGNISADPFFVQAETGNYYLRVDSPCVDKGDSDVAPDDDKKDISRPQGAEADMGAYEYVDRFSCTPRASFVIDETSGFAPLTVKLDASSSGGILYNDPDISWDFGDGNTASGMILYHTYNNYGFYNVNLTVITGCGTDTLKLCEVIYVKPSVPNREVGKGEEYPYNSIQEAIDDAGDGEMILVHDGTYSERINFKGKRITVYSENGSAATIIDGGSGGSVVTFNNNEGKYSVLDGFTIRNGSASNGGGIYCYSSSPTISNCIIEDNSVSSNGGGIYGYLSSLQVANSIIKNNFANLNGGGIYLISSSPGINHCILKSNLGKSKGGGLYIESSSPRITKTAFTGNWSVYGGGIYDKTSSYSLTNSLLGGNFSRRGGGIYSESSSVVTIFNCTITDNTSTEYGGGIYCGGASIVAKNCILWNDQNEEIYRSGGSVTITYSDIQGGYAGEGNVDADPLFVQSETGNYYIRVDSPCVDRVEPDGAPDDDKKDIPRPQGAEVDMGAYEYVDRFSCTPRASFVVDKTSGFVPLTAKFDASSSGGILYNDPDISWDFGDGNTASGMIVYHTYNDYGFYDVSLTVTTGCGADTLKLYDVIYVKSSVPTREVGKGGEYDYEYIQETIDDAGDGEMILVHDGTYSERINFKGKRITVYSENGPLTTIIDGGSGGSVFTFNNKEGIYSVLNGFTIQKGSGSNGGGIYCYFSSPIITNCIIKENSVSANGGGIYCYLSLPTITNCEITKNTARYGGGIFNDISSIQIIDCSVNENQVSTHGGGLYNSYSSLDIVDCFINKNQANSYGGGVYNTASSLNITDCSINENQANSQGGGMYNTSSSLNISKCFINENQAIYGGGMLNNSSSLDITNCIIAKNSATRGGGFYCSYSNMNVFNCIVAVNIATENGGGMYLYYYDPVIKNCIFWNNLPQEIFIYWGTPKVTCTDIQGGFSGEGNIDVDPKFIDPDGNNYHLRWDSSCVDAGCPITSVADDIEGVTRPQGEGYDMGAYEYHLASIIVKCVDEEDAFYFGIGTEEYKAECQDSSGNQGFVDDPNDPAIFYCTYQKAYQQEEPTTYIWFLKVDLDLCIDSNSYPSLQWDPDKLLVTEGCTWKLLQGENILVSDMTGINNYQIKEGDGEFFAIALECRPPCFYSVDPVQRIHPCAASDDNTIQITQITSGDACNWTATSNVSWINITRGDSGTGDGTLYYSVNENNLPDSRSGIITIEGEDNYAANFTVTQAGSKTYFRDADGDAYGDPNNSQSLCVQPEGYILNAGDCDDTDPNINQGATEVCDNLDNDCDGAVDEDLGTTTCGLGVCLHTINNCVGGVTQICDPMEGSSDEICDGFDNDCDGLTDEDLVRDCPTICGIGTQTCENGEWVPPCTCPSLCIFTLDIKATGQLKTGYENNISEVTIGIDPDYGTEKSPPNPPPDYTVDLKIIGGEYGFIRDIRAPGSDEEIWELSMIIGEAADPNYPDYFPVLSWDANAVCPPDPNNGYLKLYSVNDQGVLTLLVPDMSQIGQYQTQGSEGQYIASLGIYVFTYRIIWSKCVPVEMNFPEGWSMISLSVEPDNPNVKELFPDAVVVYTYERGKGYVRVEELQVGKGYWILFYENQGYELCGKPIHSYSKTVYSDGWEMIGGCTSDARPAADSCEIDVIYRFVKGKGYQRVLLASENLEPGGGFWIFLEDVVDQCVITVEELMPSDRLRLQSVKETNKPVKRMRVIGPEPADENWRLGITGTGQAITGANNTSTIYIGMDMVPLSFHAPGYLPNYTVDLRLAGGLLEDIRETGSARQVWSLLIEVGPYAVYGFKDYYPVLSWDTKDIGAGTLQLLRGHENGDLLVNDMRSINMYQTQEADFANSYSFLNKTFLTYTIIFDYYGN